MSLFVCNSNWTIKLKIAELSEQRAQLEISDLGSYIRVVVNWSSSAVENTKWIFEC